MNNPNPLKRSSRLDSRYVASVMWIALYDNPAENPGVVRLADSLTVMMISDVFEVPEIEVARDVLEYRHTAHLGIREWTGIPYREPFIAGPEKCQYTTNDGIPCRCNAVETVRSLKCCKQHGAIHRAVHAERASE